MLRCCSWLSICRRGCGLFWLAGPPRRCRWRLRAYGQLAELRAAELRFTAEKAAALLCEAAGPGLPSTAVAALTARTEGWAAGCSWPPCRCGDQRIRPGLRRSAAATVSCWTTWPGECSGGKTSRCADSCWNLGARAALGGAVRCGHRPGREPGDAGAG